MKICKQCPYKYIEASGIKRPNETTFYKYLPFFLNDIPDENCAKAGKAAYSNVRHEKPSHFLFGFILQLNFFVDFSQFPGCSAFVGSHRFIFHELPHKSDHLWRIYRSSRRSQTDWERYSRCHQTEGWNGWIFPIQVDIGFWDEIYSFLALTSINEEMYQFSAFSTFSMSNICLFGRIVCFLWAFRWLRFSRHPSYWPDSI